MKTIIKWLKSPVVLVTLGVLGCAGLILLGRAHSLEKSEWAAWVQTVGSIVAIISGFAVARRQAKDASRLAQLSRLEVDDDRLTAALCVARFAADLIDEAVAEAIERGNVRGYLEVSAGYLDFAGASEALASVQLHEVRSSEMVSALLKMRRYVDWLRGMTEAAQEDPAFERRDYYEWKDALLEIRTMREHAMQSIGEVVEGSRKRLREFE